MTISALASKMGQILRKYACEIYWPLSLNHLLLRLISTLLKLEIFNPSKAWSFNFRRVEISKQTNAKADDSNLTQAGDSAKQKSMTYSANKK